MKNPESFELKKDDEDENSKKENFSHLSPESSKQEKENQEEYLENYLNAVGLTWEELKNKKVLDMGADLGNFADKAKEKNIDAISLEKFPEIREEEERRTLAKKAPYVRGDMEELPFNDNSFDIIISRAAPPVVACSNKEQVEKIIKEAKRVLSPGGKFHFGPGGLDANIFSDEELDEAVNGNFQDIDDIGERKKILKEKSIDLLKSVDSNIEHKEIQDLKSDKKIGFYVLNKEKVDGNLS